MAQERWRVDFYEDDDGTRPVQQYLQTLENGEKKRFRARVEMLEQKGTWLGRPVVDFLEDNLWELRLEKSPHNPRILFCALVGRRLVLLHGFSKTGRASDKVPEAEKRIARKRREQEEAREAERERQGNAALKTKGKR